MDKFLRENKLPRIYIHNHLIHLTLILLLFLASFFLRLPHLNRFLSDHHEWVTAQSLIVLETWEIQGAIKHNFNLLQTYQFEADKYIENMGINRMDEAGNGYYASFPPFSIILPYIIFKLFSIDINVLNLQLLNLAFHLIATLFIYRVVRIALPSADYGATAAFLASILFIFLAPNLWFFSNIYSWDIFWHYIWVIYIYYVLRTIGNLEENRIRKPFLYCLSAINFFLIYSEYQGLLCSMSVILFVALQRKNIPEYKKIIVLLAITSLLAIVVTVIQYSSICGLKCFIAFLVEKYKSRSFLAQGGYSYATIFSYYKFGFSYLILPVVLILAVLIKNINGEMRYLLTRRVRLLLYLGFFPVLTQHILTLKWTATHDYSIVKSSIVIVFAVSRSFLHGDEEF